ncbi:MAG TPA: hypothetical protein PLG43_11065 [Spirochaetia bacterium]|nr:hypothetical protein [Spirochaetia bacterium]
MDKTELIQKSPIRAFEQSIHGGLGKGRIGGLAAKKGVGKTAGLVHIAIDKLMRGEHVIHVSFAERVDHIITWYENVYREIARDAELEGKDDMYEELTRNRVIMNFKQEGVQTRNVLASLESIVKDGHFPANCIIFDGYDLAKASHEDVSSFRTFAQKTDCEIWFSLSLKGPEPLFDEQGIPNELKPFIEDFDVLITMRFDGEDVRMRCIKDQGRVAPMEMGVKIDSKTMLIAKK